jgi:hypothetical protein
VAALHHFGPILDSPTVATRIRFVSVERLSRFTDPRGKVYDGQSKPISPMEMLTPTSIFPLEAVQISIREACSPATPGPTHNAVEIYPEKHDNSENFTFWNQRNLSHVDVC